MMNADANRESRVRVPRKVLLGVVALGIAASAAAVYRVFMQGGAGPESQVIAVAFRADGGSPAVTVAYGHPYDIKLDLPAADYYVQLVNGADTIMNLGKVPFSDGHGLSVSKFSGPDANHEDAAALRTIANFVNDVEAARLDALSAASGDFTQPLFTADVSGDDLARFYASYLALGDQEASVTAALKRLSKEMADREPVRYVRADPAPRSGLGDTLLDKLLPDLFNRMRKLPERERERVAQIIAQMDAAEKQAAFESMPANLRGDAANFNEWQQAVKRGDLDQQLGAIHGHLYVEAIGATQKAGQTPGKAIAEEGGPLIESGADLMVKAYGKVPHIGKAIDVTKKALEWESYVRKLYNDPNAGAAAILKGPYQKLAKDRIKADLQKMMPNASPSVIDALAGQLAKRMATALAAGLKAPASAANAAPGGSTSGFPPAAEAEASSTPDAPAWIDELVNAIAQRLLGEGHRGIEVAVVTDDLRVCLRGGVAANLGRDQALSACAYILERIASATPATEAEPSSPPVDTPVPAEQQPADTPVPPAAPPADCPTPDSDGNINTDIDGVLRCQKSVPPPPPPPPPPPAPCQSYDPACGLAGH